MIDEGVNALGWVIFILPSHEVANGSKKNGKGRMRVKMVGADECSLDVGGFIFVFHFVECRADGLLQRLLVISDEHVIKAQLFLKNGSASMLTLYVGKGGLDGLLQLGIFNILRLCGPFCFLVKGILYACFHKFLNYGFRTFANE